MSVLAPEPGNPPGAWKPAWKRLEAPGVTAKFAHVPEARNRDTLDEGTPRRRGPEEPAWKDRGPSWIG